MKNTTQFKAKIRNLALQNHIPAQAVLQEFMLERLLERVSISQYHNNIVLKGGLLISSLVGISTRTTMDMDVTLQRFPLREDTIQMVFTEICSIQAGDEIEFNPIGITPIRDDDIYGGYRITLNAKYDSIVIPLKIDITAGDVITPEAVEYLYSSNFDDKLIKIWSYNLETILAEKIETVLHRSVLNTRPRDFYDIYTLLKSKKAMIDIKIFRTALTATSQKRGSYSEIQNSENILHNIQKDESMKLRWDRYSREYHYANGISFDEIIVLIDEFLKTAFINY